MFEPLAAIRVVSTPVAIDAASFGGTVMRTAPDEALLIDPPADVVIDDPHAIVVDETGFVGARLDATTTAWLFERGCEWEIPDHRPAFAQGMVLGIAAKVWFDMDGALVVVPAAVAVDFADRYETVERRDGT